MWDEINWQVLKNFFLNQTKTSRNLNPYGYCYVNTIFAWTPTRLRSSSTSLPCSWVNKQHGFPIEWQLWQTCNSLCIWLWTLTPHHGCRPWPSLRCLTYRLRSLLVQYHQVNQQIWSKIQVPKTTTNSNQSQLSIPSNPQTQRHDHCEADSHQRWWQQECLLLYC